MLLLDNMCYLGYQALEERVQNFGCPLTQDWETKKKKKESY